MNLSVGLSLWRSQLNMLTNNHEVLTALQTASEQLVFVSEADYPFTTLMWENCALSREQILERIGYDLSTPIKIVELDDFFAVTITEQDWHEQEEQRIVERYKKLLKVLKQNLTDIKVYRLGVVDIDVYIIGKTADGDFAGLATKVIET